MLYGSGEYDARRALTSYPGPRVRPEAVEIAGRHNGSDMKACFDVPRKSVFGNKSQSMNVSQTAGPMRHMGVSSPIPVDPVYNNGKYSNRSARPVARVKPEAEEIAEKSKGCVGLLFSNYGRPDPYEYQQNRDDNMNPKNGPLRKAGIKNPILVDPVYNKGEYSGRSPRPAPRVKPEASEWAERSRGTVGNLLKTPDVRFFKSAKPKKESPDHEKENVRRMRKIQRQSREKEREKEKNKPTPVKALWKSTRYESIESKVKTKFEEPPCAPRGAPPRPSSAPPSCNRPSSAQPGKRSNRMTQTVECPQESLTPRRQAEKRVDNIIARNARLAKTYKPQNSKSQLEIYRSQTKYEEGNNKYNENVRGTTPAYLLSRQREWAKQERDRIRNMPDPTVPDGHTVLPDKDRRGTLQILRKSQVELLNEYRLLPVRSADSFGVRNRKTELERRIAEVDEAITVFERPKVFVKMDE